MRLPSVLFIIFLFACVGLGSVKLAYSEKTPNTSYDETPASQDSNVDSLQDTLTAHFPPPVSDK